MLNDLMNRTFTGEIEEGQHKAMLTKFEYKQHPTNTAYDYLAMTFVVDGKREFKRNMFERDISIMLSQTRRQLNRANEDINPTDYLADLVDKKIPLDIWLTYPIVATRNGPRRVQNIAWQHIETSESEEEEEEIPGVAG